MITKVYKTIVQSASVWSVLAMILRTGGGLITLPLALRSISKEEMGLYYTIMGVVSIASLLDFGFSSAVTRNAGYAMGGALRFTARGVPKFSGNTDPNWLLLDQLLQVAKRWNLALAGLVFVGLATLGTFFIEGQISRAQLPGSLVLCWLLIVVSVCFTLATTFWYTMLVGAGFVRKAAITSIVGQFIALLVLGGCLVAGVGIWSYAISLMVGSILGLVIPRWIYLQTIPKRDFGGTNLNVLPILKDLWPMAWRQGVVLLGAYLIQRGNVLVCSAKLGLDETASFGLSLSLLAIIFQVANVPLQMAMPKISQLRVQGNNPLIRTTFFLRLYGGLAAAALGVVFLTFFGNSILNLIGSKTHLLGTVPFVVLGIVWLLENHHSQYASLVLSENENPFMWPAILSGIFIFGLSWYAAGIWGVLGLIVAQGLVQAAWNNWWTVLRGLAGISRTRAPQ